MAKPSSRADRFPEGAANRIQGGGRLARQKSGSAHTGFELGLENEARARHLPFELARRAGPDGIVLAGYSLPAFVLEVGKRVHALPFNARARDWLSAQSPG
jgi:hypothetical protein